MIETEESLGARAIFVECATIMVSLLPLFTHKSIKTLSSKQKKKKKKGIKTRGL